jgi:hypothetical protein
LRFRKMNHFAWCVSRTPARKESRMNIARCGAAALGLSTLFALAVPAGEPENQKKYALRYQFHPGETVRWEVEHRSMVKASVNGTMQTTESTSESMKAWSVAEVRKDGSVVFEHRVEWVDMRQKLSSAENTSGHVDGKTGRYVSPKPIFKEVSYDSRTDKTAPPGFEDAARWVGVPLTTVTMDAYGKILDRKRHEVGKPDNKGHNPNAANVAAQKDGWMTIPLPDKPVPIGYSWSFPQDIDVPMPDGTVKKIKAIQQFLFEEVRSGVAVIRVSTDILTPITDPAVESQLIQRESSGRVRFDIEEGRILGQQMDTDKYVVGFRGDASSIHYVNRFTERLVTEPQPQPSIAKRSPDRKG